MWSSRHASEARAAVTVDLHAGDCAKDIRRAAHHLWETGIRATFFVPGELFRATGELRDALRELPSLQHEVGSHGDRHDWNEVDALTRAHTPEALRFLQSARDAFADFYGVLPKAFRSPVWCRPSALAFDELVRLGYEVDSSAAPQRLQFLSSRPFCPGWMFAPRSPHLVRPELLEVPTSAVVLQAGSTTFRLLRRSLSIGFARALLAEAAICPSRVAVLQFDSRDFSSTSAPLPATKWQLTDWWPRRNGGFALRRHLLDGDPCAIAATTQGILRLLRAPRTMSELRAEWKRPS